MPVIASLLGGILSGLTGGIAGLAVDGFTAIVKALFEPLANLINTELIGWLIAVPNYTQGSVAQLEQTVTAMGGAALAAVATISIARFWVAGLAGGGQAFDAIEGLTRTIGAALILPIWPWIFDAAVRLSDAASTGLLGSGSVTADSAKLLADGFGAGVGITAIDPTFGLFLAIVIAAGAALLFLALLLVKIVLGVSTVLIFVGMPAAIVLWPAVPWIARVLARAFAVCLIVPFVWALCFASSAALNVNVLEGIGGGGTFDKLLEPLVALMLLWVMVTLPRKLGHLAMLGGGGHVRGGFVSRTVSYAAGSQLRHSASEQLSSLTGNRRGSSGGTDGGQQAESRHRSGAGAGAAAATAATGGLAAGAATTAAAGAASATGAATSAAAPGAGAAGTTASHAGGATGERAYTPPAGAAAPAGSGGLQAPSFAGRERDMDAELLEARVREQTNPVTVPQAQAALEALPEATRQGVAQLTGEHGERAREQLAYQALGEWTPDQREALRTLAAATPEVRAQALTNQAATPATHTAAGTPPAQPAANQPSAMPPEQPTASSPRAAVVPAPVEPAPHGDEPGAPYPAAPIGGSHAADRPGNGASTGSSDAFRPRDPQDQRTGDQEGNGR